MNTTLIQLLESLESISPQEKRVICSEAQKLSGKLQQVESNLKESEKERLLATKYLNETILDLEKNHKQLREANKFLAHQNEIIDSNLQKLISAYEELEQFTYIASHDLKSPLRTIASYAQLLHNKYSNQLDRKAKEYLDIIIQSMHNMTDVIDDSLAYSRIGKEGVKRTKPVALNDVLETVIKNLESEIQETNATITFDELPTIIGKRTNFIQLFQNLISNSIKYRTEVKPIINISSSAEDDGWILQFVDNGKGIEQKYHEAIFQPFKRINDDRISGAGIGLAICKKICQMYNGNISITSDVNKGTTFTVKIRDLILS